MLIQPTQKKAKTNMLKFIQKTSVNKLLPKCGAHDEFSFRAMMCTSALAKFIVKRHYEVPRREK